MKTLFPFELPSFYKYYRSSSNIFKKYYASLGYSIIPLGNNGEFARAEKKLFGLYWKVEVIKCESEISQEILSQYGIKRAFVFWTPIRKRCKPQGWYALPSFFALFQLHSSRSAFTTLRQDYKKTWSRAARNHAKNIYKKMDAGEVFIKKENSIEDFLVFLSHKKNHDPQKRLIIRMTRKLFSHSGKNHYRIYSLYAGEKKIASALFLDDGNISEYWASCYFPESKKYHAGIAMIDIWMKESLDLGIKICDFDHMRDRFQSKSFAGYTQFKSGIAEYDIKFRDLWIRRF